MAFQWTSHRFSGGLLAFDLVNTVVCREDPARRADRLEDPENIEGFVAAAAKFRMNELGGCDLIVPPNADMRTSLLGLREAVNDWVRPQIKGEQDSGDALSRLFAAAAKCSMPPIPDGGVPLGRAAALSAMRLFDPAIMARTKTCPNCDWLFLDNSKNRSRLWCDMNVCGNRAKAKAHYQRKSGAQSSNEERP